jgi:hypothetical protein
VMFLIFGFDNLFKSSVNTNQYDYTQLNINQKSLLYKSILFGLTSFSVEIKSDLTKTDRQIRNFIKIQINIIKIRIDKLRGLDYDLQG